MSYSRWSNSRWYTYWHATDSKYADEQVLSVDCELTFSYLQLKEDLEGCLDKVRQEKKRKEESHKDYVEPTEKDIQELKGYMEEFVKDVESTNTLIKDGFHDDPEGRRINRSEW